MTFTYSPSATPTDLTRVRFHTGQTVSAESFLSDEEIAMMIAEETTWKPAVIAGLKFIILKLSQPDFQADWLKVSNGTARAGYQLVLNEKRREFGISAITATAVHTYRADSLATEAPDYESTDDE